MLTSLVVDFPLGAAAQLDAAVDKPRRLGRSWADIGAATDMTRQSANARW